MMRQGKHKKPLQFDKTHLLLNKTLGDSTATYHLAAHICHEDVELPLAQVFTSILESGTHIHNLLSVISACEQQRLQYVFYSTKTLPMETQFATAKKTINDFNHIQDTLLSSADSFFDYIAQQKTHDISQLQADTGNRSIQTLEFEHKSYQDTINSSISNWKKSKHISIRNYHQGLTVRTVAEFIHAQGDTIQIKLNEEVARIFAIHPSESDVFAVCDGENIQVRLSIQDMKHGILTLNIGKTFPIYSENRKHLSIQVVEQVPVTIRMGRKRHLHASLHDLSMGGIGISIHGINQAPYNIGDKVECQLTLGAKPVNLDGIVRWTGNSNEEARIGIELIQSSHSQQLIQKEVFRMQRSIISTINQLELPDQFQEALV